MHPPTLVITTCYTFPYPEYFYSIVLGTDLPFDKDLFDEIIDSLESAWHAESSSVSWVLICVVPCELHPIGQGRG